MARRPCVVAVVCVALAAVGAYGRNESLPVLSSWQADLMPLIGTDTVMDMSVPGSHDSATADLTGAIADHNASMKRALAWVLHTLGHIFPAKVATFLKAQSVNQVLSLEQQLAAGMRFIDFRNVYTRGPHVGAKSDWYCVHTMETLHPAAYHMEAMASWVKANPGEVLVVSISRHGSCESSQYAGISTSVKQEWWAKIVSMFDDGKLIFDHSKARLNETSMAEMVRSGRRVVFIAADHDDFTNSSSLAADCTMVTNVLGSGVDTEASAWESEVAMYRNMSALKAENKAANKYLLRSLATSGSKAMVLAQAKLFFHLYVTHSEREAAVRKCARTFEFNVSGAGEYCPASLLSIAHLAGFYKQETLELAHTNGWDFPVAFYTDAIMMDGTVPTGKLDGHDSHDKSRYAYAATVILANARRHETDGKKAACQADQACASALNKLRALRAMYPMRTWSDPQSWRFENWPVDPSPSAPLEVIV